MDKTLRAEIKGEMRAIMLDILEASKEQWVSGEELGRQISCFTKGWLKEYGCYLPRTRAIVIDAEGIEHCSAWTYPLHKIQRMMATNQIKHLTVKYHESN